jgi:hypothetical protein
MKLQPNFLQHFNTVLAAELALYAVVLSIVVVVVASPSTTTPSAAVWEATMSRRSTSPLDLVLAEEFLATEFLSLLIPHPAGRRAQAQRLVRRDRRDNGIKIASLSRPARM